MKKWIFRLLTLFVVICALGLFSLSVVSGTGESQKRGLEQSFSRLFAGDARFGVLKKFNIIPQLTIDVENLEISSIKNGAGFSADRLEIAFGIMDLILENRKIESFHLKNLVLGEGVYTPLKLTLDDAGIYTKTTKIESAHFTFTGTYGDKNISGQIGMGLQSGFQPKYFFEKENDFLIVIGMFEINGIFSPNYEPDSPEAGGFHSLKISALKDTTDTKCIIKPDKKFSRDVFIKDVLGTIATFKTPADLKKTCGIFNQ